MSEIPLLTAGEAQQLLVEWTARPEGVRDPFLADISAPIAEDAHNAFTAGALSNKQVVVTGSRYGGNGRLVVTASYSSGYTISDVECQDAGGSPPCEADDYDHAVELASSCPHMRYGLRTEVREIDQLGAE